MAYSNSYGSQGNDYLRTGGTSRGVRDGIPFAHYPGQTGVLVPNPTLGQTNFGKAISQNMPYGPFYAYPPKPFKTGQYNT